MRSEPEALAPVTDWLEHYRRTSEERFQRLDALLSALPSADSPSADSPSADSPVPTTTD